MQREFSIARKTDREETWYLVQVKPGGFSRAEINLRRQGFETFMPLRPETRRKFGKLLTELRPLFPGYLFVSVDPDRQDWRKINNTFGVSRLVCLDGLQPCKVPSPLIHGLMDASGDDVWTSEPANLPVGAAVSLVCGPFAGAIARTAAASENGRVLVLIEMMGRNVHAAVPLRSVEPASELGRAARA